MSMYLSRKGYERIHTVEVKIENGERRTIHVPPILYCKLLDIIEKIDNWDVEAQWAKQQERRAKINARYYEKKGKAYYREAYHKRKETEN